MKAINEGWSESRLQKLQSQNSESLRTWQAEQLQGFLSMGFPDCKIEDWKYTDITPIASQTFSFGEFVECDITNFIIEDTHRMVFINGHFAPTLSHLMHLPDGVELMSLKTTENRMEMLEEIPIYQTSFSLLNNSLFQDGMLLRVPKNFQLEKPIHLLHLMRPNRSCAMTQTRHLIVLEENSKATLLEEYRGVCSTTYFNNIVTQINVGASANLVFYKLQEENDYSFHIANTQIRQARNSQVITCYFSFGSMLGREDLNYALEGRNASCQLLGFYHLTGNRHIDNHTRIDHSIDSCSSQQIYKGVMSDKSRAVFNGKIVVHPDAKKTVAHQVNRNLILSNKAKVNTKPQLEIYHDDVNCTHGATVGQLDKEALFYLRSRGIDRATAEHLLVCAFSSEIIEKLKHKMIARRIYQRISEHLTLLRCPEDCHG